jgi:hypothetical protein
MTICELRERNRQSLYSIPRKKVHLGYKQRESPNRAILECLTQADIALSQAYFWTPNWISAEKEADEDIKENRVQIFRTADKIIKYLNS